jgi:serine/threonine-protein kinase
VLLGPPRLRTLRADTPATLEAILLRCMQPDPGNRYASVAELAGALAEVAPAHARIFAVRAARILTGPDGEPMTRAARTSTAHDSGPAIDSATRRRGADEARDPALDAGWRDPNAQPAGVREASTDPRLRALPSGSAETRSRRALSFWIVAAIAVALSAIAIQLAPWPVRARVAPVPSIAESPHAPKPVTTPAAASASEALSASAVLSAAISPSGHPASSASVTASPPANAPRLAPSAADAGGGPAPGPSMLARPQSTDGARLIHTRRSTALLDAGLSLPVPAPRDPLADPD